MIFSLDDSSNFFVLAQRFLQFLVQVRCQNQIERRQCDGRDDDVEPISETRMLARGKRRVSKKKSKEKTNDGEAL